MHEEGAAWETWMWDSLCRHLEPREARRVLGLHCAARLASLCSVAIRPSQNSPLSRRAGDVGRSLSATQMEQRLVALFAE